MKPLSYISIEATRRCNLNCPFCILGNNNKTGDLTKRDLFKFINNNHDQFGDITLTGGEPTLRSDLDKIIKGIHKYGKRVAIITNGSTNPIRILNAKPDLVKISLDFPNAQHDLWRGKENLAYNIIHRVIPTLQRNSIPIEILFTVTTKNISELEQMVHLARNLDTKLIFQRYIPKSRDDELNLNQQQLHYLFNFIKEKLNEGEHISYYGGLGHFISDKANFCGAGLVKCHICVNKQITPCMFLLDKSYGTINNSFRQTRDNILNFRKEYEKKVIEKCGSCPSYPYTCAGDCIAIAKTLEKERGQCWI